MKLNTTQVADKLGVSGTTVRGLVKSKKLTDISGKIGRHEYLFNSKEVNELAKTFKPHRRLNTNGKENHSPLSGLFSKLEAINNKLDRLINMWS